MKRVNVGGQGVLEGVMMRSPTVSALAVRKNNGEIVYQKDVIQTKEKNWFAKLPVIRGLLAFIDTMVMGVKTLMDSAKLYDETAAEENYKPSKFEQFLAEKTGKNAIDVMMGMAVVIAVVLAVGLFFLLPTFLAGLFRPIVSSKLLLNLIAGVIRVLIFLGYLIGVSFMKDIKRVFMYHGAEHKVINCYEHDCPMTVEEIQKHKRLHPRCGTSYLFFVILMPILVFSLIDWSDLWYVKFGLRILLLPLIAGLAYELLKYAAKKENWFFRALRWPGLMLQKITTKPPDDSMVEVAMVAFFSAMDELSDEEIRKIAENFDRSEKKESATAERETEEIPSEANGEVPAEQTADATTQEKESSESQMERSVDSQTDETDKSSTEEQLHTEKQEAL